MSMASSRTVIGTLFIMRSYIVPPNTNEKEKVIGGVLNINQFFWVLAGLLIGGLVIILTHKILGQFSIVLGLVFASSGLPFVLYKKNDLTLFQYITLKRKFDKKVKKLPNRRKEVEW